MHIATTPMVARAPDHSPPDRAACAALCRRHVILRGDGAKGRLLHLLAVQGGTRPLAHAYHSWAMPRLLATLAGLVVAGALAQAAPASAGFTDLGWGAGPAVTDGSRWAAWRLDFGERTRLVDTWTGRVFTLSTPEVVSRPPSRGPCGLAGLGGGYVAWDCHPTSYLSGTARPPAVEVMSLSTHQRVPVRGLDALPRHLPSDAYGFNGVGSHWLSGYTVSPPIRGFFLNWRTGEIRRPPPPRSRTLVDLERPGLTFRLCQGPPTPDSGYQFEYPFGLAVRSPGRGPFGVATLRLDRCGHRSRDVARCRCSGGRLGGGLVSWVSGETIAILHARTGRRATLATAGLVASAGYAGSARATHTTRRVFLSVTGSGGWRIYAAPVR